MNSILKAPQSGSEPFAPNILTDSGARKKYTDVAIKGFLRIADEWRLTAAQTCAIVGGISPMTLSRWKAGKSAKLDRDQLERISITLGIYKALKLLFVDEAGRMAWFKATNTDYAFKGLSPLERMTQGGMLDLYAVRQYLDGLRGAR